MIAKLKMWLGIALTAVFFGLTGYASHQKKRAENAAEDAEEAKADAGFAEERVKRHESRQKIEDDIAMGDEPGIDERLRKYYRD